MAGRCPHVTWLTSLSLDAQFPIDISSVTKDHDFLDRDAIEALCRWDYKSCLKPFIRLLSFFWWYVPFFLFLIIFSLSLSFLYYHYFSLWWNHEGTTSKRAMLWKVADEIKESHDKQPCTSPPCLVSLCSYLLPPLFSSLSGTDRVYLSR